MVERRHSNRRSGGDTEASGSFRRHFLRNEKSIVVEMRGG